MVDFPELGRPVSQITAALCLLAASRPFFFMIASCQVIFLILISPSYNFKKTFEKSFLRKIFLGLDPLLRQLLTRYNQVRGFTNFKRKRHYIDFSQEKIKPFSLEYDLFPKLVKNRKLIAHATEELENFTDIGTPDSYREVCKK